MMPRIFDMMRAGSGGHPNICIDGTGMGFHSVKALGDILYDSYMNGGGQGFGRGNGFGYNNGIGISGLGGSSETMASAICGPINSIPIVPAEVNIGRAHV
jgi:hypothetical protein